MTYTYYTTQRPATPGAIPMQGLIDIKNYDTAGNQIYLKFKGRIKTMKTLNYDKNHLRKLQNNYFTAKALYETIRETAESIQKNILAKNEFYISREWREETAGEPQRITRPFDSYLMNDDDFNKYLDLCYAAYKAAGIADKRGREYIPEADSKDLLKEAENQVIEYAIEILPDEQKDNKRTLREAAKLIKYRGRILDLILRLEC